MGLETDTLHTIHRGKILILHGHVRRATIEKWINKVTECSPSRREGQAEYKRIKWTKPWKDQALRKEKIGTDGGIVQRSETAVSVNTLLYIAIMNDEITIMDEDTFKNRFTFGNNNWNFDDRSDVT